MTRGGVVLGVMLLVGMVPAMLGCGAADTRSAAVDRGQIRGAIRDLQRAADRGDMVAACEHLTTGASHHLGTAGHGSPTTCPQDLRRVWRWLRGGPPPRIESLILAGDHATATMALSGGAEGRIPLAREDGEWKVDALYGDVPGGEQKDHYQ